MAELDYTHVQFAELRADIDPTAVGLRLELTAAHDEAWRVGVERRVWTPPGDAQGLIGNSRRSMPNSLWQALGRFGGPQTSTLTAAEALTLYNWLLALLDHVLHLAWAERNEELGERYPRDALDILHFHDDDAPVRTSVKAKNFLRQFDQSSDERLLVEFGRFHPRFAVSLEDETA